MPSPKNGGPLQRQFNHLGSIFSSKNEPEEGSEAIRRRASFLGLFLEGDKNSSSG